MGGLDPVSAVTRGNYQSVSQSHSFAAPYAATTPTTSGVKMGALVTPTNEATVAVVRLPLVVAVRLEATSPAVVVAALPSVAWAT
ncbi:hypothetical protein D3C85_1326760 [compost metagenome]